MPSNAALITMETYVGGGGVTHIWDMGYWGVINLGYGIRGLKNLGYGIWGNNLGYRG